MPAPAVVACSFDSDEFPQQIRPQPQENTRLEVAYLGTLYGPRSPVPILEALARLRREGRLSAETIRIRFVGSFELPGEPLADLISRLGVSEMATAEPQVSQALALQVLADADCGLLIAEGHPLQIPAKAYEYIGMRKPIFALADGATADLVTTEGIGIVCQRDHVDAALLLLVDTWRANRFAGFAESLESAAGRYEAGQRARQVIGMLASEFPR